MKSCRDSAELWGRLWSVWVPSVRKYVIHTGTHVKPTSAACGFTGLLWIPQKAFFSTGNFAPSLGKALAVLLPGADALHPTVQQHVPLPAALTEPPGSETLARTPPVLFPRSRQVSLCLQVIPSKAGCVTRRRSWDAAWWALCSECPYHEPFHSNKSFFVFFFPAGVIVWMHSG